MIPPRRRPARARAIARALTCLSASTLLACSSFSVTPDAGLDATPCSGTALRGHQPLGKASQESSQSGLVWAGNGMGAVWEERSGSGGAIYWAKVGTLGNVTGVRQVAQGRDPVLLRAGSELQLYWRQGTALMRQILDDSGATKGSPAQIHSPITSSFAVASSGQTLAFALNGVAATGDEVYLLRLGLDGSKKSGPTKIPQQGINSTLASLAWTGKSFALAWTDMRAGLPAVYFVLLDEEGTRRGSDLRLSDARYRGSFPTVAPQYNGGVVVCYLQKMETNLQNLFCSRLDSDGKVTLVKRLTQSAYDSQSPQAVTHGTLTWVLWDGVFDVSYGQAILWQFLTESGETILAQPKYHTDLLGWRPSAASRSEGLFLIKYRQDSVEGWKAEVGTLNCF